MCRAGKWASGHATDLWLTRVSRKSGVCYIISVRRIQLLATCINSWCDQINVSFYKTFYYFFNRSLKVSGRFQLICDYFTQGLTSPEKFACKSFCANFFGFGVFWFKSQSGNCKSEQFTAVNSGYPRLWNFKRQSSWVIPG